MPFVIGAPRSGTTLLRFMLDAHPSMAIPPETGFLAAPTLRGDAVTADSLHRTVTAFPPDAPDWLDFAPRSYHLCDGARVHEIWEPHRLEPGDRKKLDRLDALLCRAGAVATGRVVRRARPDYGTYDRRKPPGPPRPGTSA